MTAHIPENDVNDPDSWIEMLADALKPHCWPGRQYDAARAVMRMPVFADGFVLAGDTTEHSHREFGQGYFFTPDATIFLAEQLA